MARQSAGESTLSRAVRIFEAFDAGVRDLSATQIATISGMPLTTVHRLLRELVGLGLVERAANRRYRIGLRLWELAVRTPGALGIRETALPAMRAAHAAIGQHLQLGVLHNDDVLYLERLSAPHPVVNVTIVGGTLPLTATSSGFVLAAFSDPETQRRLAARPRRPLRYAPALTPAEFRERLNTVRARGHEITVGLLHPDATSIAVPVFGPLGRVIAALSAVVPSADPREEFVLATLHGAAKAIRTALTRRYSGDDLSPEAEESALTAARAR